LANFSYSKSNSYKNTQPSGKAKYEKGGRFVGGGRGSSYPPKRDHLAVYKHPALPESEYARTIRIFLQKSPMSSSGHLRDNISRYSTRPVEYAIKPSRKEIRKMVDEIMQKDAEKIDPDVLELLNREDVKNRAETATSISQLQEDYDNNLYNSEAIKKATDSAETGETQDKKNITAKNDNKTGIPDEIIAAGSGARRYDIPKKTTEEKLRNLAKEVHPMVIRMVEEGLVETWKKYWSKTDDMSSDIDEKMLDAAHAVARMYDGKKSVKELEDHILWDADGLDREMLSAVIKFSANRMHEIQRLDERNETAKTDRFLEDYHLEGLDEETKQNVYSFLEIHRMLPRLSDKYDDDYNAEAISIPQNDSDIPIYESDETQQKRVDVQMEKSSNTQDDVSELSEEKSETENIVQKIADDKTNEDYTKIAYDMMQLKSEMGSLDESLETDSMNVPSENNQNQEIDATENMHDTSVDSDAGLIPELFPQNAELAPDLQYQNQKKKDTSMMSDGTSEIGEFY